MRRFFVKNNEGDVSILALVTIIQNEKKYYMFVNLTHDFAYNACFPKVSTALDYLDNFYKEWHNITPS